MKTVWIIVKAAAVIVAFTAFPAMAQTAASNPIALTDDIYAKSLSALTILLVTAVLLESAFATIFNWRVFLTYFSLRGVKTIVMVIISLLVVKLFNLDVLASLIAAYKTPKGALESVAVESGAVSQFVTALILAGGSNGVYNLLSALGYRSNREEEVAPKPREDEAWVAIRVKRQNAVGEVQVSIQPAAPLAAGTPAPSAIAGTIGFKRPSLLELLLRNTNRFPQNGGYVVKPNLPYSIFVEGKDANGTLIKGLDQKLYVFSPRAVVDFEVTL
jgi:hypothetical protein